MRLIDADALREKAQYSNRFESDEQIVFLDDIDTAPTVDAVPVVRCAECKLHDNCYTEDVFKFAKLNDDKRFCGAGERKGGDE